MLTRTIRYGLPVFVALGVAACLASFTIGGTVSGLTGTGLILKFKVRQYISSLSGYGVMLDEILNIDTNGAFAFKNPFPITGTEYWLSVAKQPDGQICMLSNDKNATRGVSIRSDAPVANVTDIQVQCGAGLQFKLLAGMMNIGSADGVGAAAGFNHPAGIAADDAGNIYVADAANHILRKITPQGGVTTLAGLAGVSGKTDGIGTAARFYGPSGVAVDSQGYIYVAETLNHSIRKISPAGEVTTLAGTAGISGITNGIGTVARFKEPSAIALDKAGNVFVLDSGNDAIRKITPQGLVTTYFQKGDGYSSMDGIAVDAAGNVYTVFPSQNVIFMINPSGHLTVLNGNTVTQYAWPGATVIDLKFNDMKFDTLNGPIAVDGTGTIYVHDHQYNVAHDGQYMMKISPDGVVTAVGQTGVVNEGTQAKGLVLSANKFFITQSHTVAWSPKP